MIFSSLNTRVRLLAVIGLFFLSVSVASAAGSGTTEYFPPDYVWNYPVDNLPVHQFSSHWLADIKADDIAYCTGAWCAGTQNDPAKPYRVWPYPAIPINYEYGTTPHTNVSSWGQQDGPNGNSDKIAAPLRPDLKVQTDCNDRIMIIVDVPERKAYEFFHAALQPDNTWTCDAEFVWDLDGYRILGPGNKPSVSASGAPMIAGFITYEELQKGEVNHAIGGIIRAVNYSVVWPASGVVVATNKNNYFPPYGARMRLKSGKDISSFGTQAKAIATAMKKYGVIIRETGSVGVSLAAEKDSRINWADSNMTGLTRLTLDDFEFIDESSLMITPISGKVNTSSAISYVNFTGNVTRGSAPLAVQFSDLSTGSPTGWSWTFGDGGLSTLRNPTHTYTSAGTFTVGLTVTSTGVNSTKVMTNFVTVAAPTPTPTPTLTPTLTPTPTPIPIPIPVLQAPDAQFISSTTNGVTPLTVQFTDKSDSSGATTYAWDINNDGIVESRLKNPSLTYTSAGMKTVKLTVTNASGSDSEIKTNYITISAPPKAQFTANTRRGKAPLTVQFTDKSDSTGTTTYEWDINNDGVVDSIVKNPVITYTLAGTKSVKLTVTNASGNNSIIKTSYIKVS